MPVLIYFLLLFTPLAAKDFAVMMKHQGLEPITRYYVYGERCSGTNFLHQLIGKNCKLHQMLWCHKHFPPYYHLGREHWKGPDNIYYHNHCEDALFIVVVRNPYSWIQSLNIQPHSAALSLYDLPLSEFIRTPWITDEHDPCLSSERKTMPLADLDPDTGLPFASVMQLRNAKNKAYLQLLDYPPNVLLVRYEDVRDFPREFLEYLADVYGITFNTEYTPIDHYKGCEYWPIYTPKQYREFSRQDLELVNQELDWTQEHFLGYKRGTASIVDQTQ